MFSGAGALLLPGYTKKKQQQQQREQVELLNNRLQDLLAQPDNTVCSDCSETHPTWAFLLSNPVDEQVGAVLGGFCCSGCRSHFMELGNDVCIVKRTGISEGDWILEEVEVLEGSGNLAVNRIYEATLEEDAAEQERRRAGFIRRKYQLLKFFKRSVYLEHVKIRKEKSCDTNAIATLENSSLQKEKSHGQKSKTDARTKLVQVSGQLDELKESHDSDDEKKPGSSGDGQLPSRNQRSSRLLEKQAGESSKHRSESPRPIRRRRSARDLVCESDGNDNEVKRSAPLRRRKSARDLDALKMSDSEAKRTRPIRRRRSARDTLKVDPFTLALTQKTVQGMHSTSTSNSHEADPRTSQSDRDRKPNSSRSPIPLQRSGQQIDRRKSNLRTSTSDPDLKTSKVDKSDLWAELSWSPADFRNSENEANHEDTERTRLSRDCSKQQHRKDGRPIHMSSEPTRVKNLCQEPGRKSCRNSREHSYSRLTVKTRDKTSSRMSRKSIASRTRSSPNDLRRMKNSLSGDDTSDEARAIDYVARRKKATRTRSSPEDLARLAASASNIEKAQKLPRPKQVAKGGRREQQSSNIYKTRRAKMSASMSNTRFDAFLHDNEEDSESGESILGEGATRPPEAGPLDEASHNSVLHDDMKESKLAIKKIKKSLSSVPKRITEIVKPPSVAWLVLSLLVLLQRSVATASMLSLLRDDDLESIERSKLVKAYKTMTRPTNHYLIHHDCAFDDKSVDGPAVSCQAEEAHRRSFFRANLDDKKEQQPLVCLAFLSCCGRTDLLQSTLNAVIRHMEEDEPQLLREHYEIAWVDNGSPIEKQQHIANTFEIDHALPMPRNMGLAWGMNALLFDMCTAPYILLLEEDWLYMDAAVAEPTIPRKHAIAQAITLLQSDPVDPETQRPLKGVFLRTESNIVPTSKGLLSHATMRASASTNGTPYKVDNLEYRISCMKFQQTGHIFGAFTNGAGLYERKALTDQVGRMYGEPGDVFSDLSVEGNYCFRVGLQFCAARIPMDPQLSACDYDSPNNMNIPATCAAAFAHIGGGRGTRPARRKHMKCVDDAWNFYGTPYFDQVPKEPCSAELGTIWEQLKLNAHFQEINDKHNEAVFAKEQEQRRLMLQMADLFEDKARRPEEFRKYYGGHNPQYAAMSDDEIRNFPSKLRNMAQSPHQLPGFWDILGRPVGVDFDVP